MARGSSGWARPRLWSVQDGHSAVSAVVDGYQLGCLIGAGCVGACSLAPDSKLGFEIVDLRDDLQEIVGRHVDVLRR